MHLCVSGQAGLYRQAVGKFRMSLLILLCSFYLLRVRADDGHLAFQYIPKLRKLIQMRDHQEISAADPWIRIADRLAHRQRSELVLPEMLSISREAFLLFHDRPAVCDLDVQCDEPVQPGQRYQHKQRYDDVKQPFQDSLLDCQSAVSEQLHGHIRKGDFLRAHQQNI